MSTQTDTLADLTRTVIREKIAAFNERERELCAQAHGAFEAGLLAGSKTGTVSEQQRLVHDRARILMNGAGHLIPDIADSPDRVQAIETELAAVRLALRVLNEANLEKEAIELATWVEDNTPKWRTLMRNQMLALAAFIEANDACVAFLDANESGGRATALPFRYHRHVDRAVLDFAVRDGLVKASEVKGVRRA